MTSEEHPHGTEADEFGDVGDDRRIAMTAVHEPGRRIALACDRIFDGTAVLDTAHPVVVIVNGRVDSVGRPPPTGAVVRHYPGTTVLPGLIDTHVHLAFDASADPVAALLTHDDAALLAAMETRARRALRAGITTVRDLGDRGHLAQRLRGRSDLPTVLAAGPPLTTVGGHCHFLGGAVDPAIGVEAAVRAHADRGADVIKVMASGGTLTPGTRQHGVQFTPDELRRLVETAHELNLPVTAHAHAPAAIRAALEAGVDGLEHVTFWTADGVDAPDELLDAVAESGVFVGATLGFDPPGAYDELPEPLARRLPIIDVNIAELHRRGARVLVGTDAGVATTKHHAVLPYGVSHLASLGLPAREALRAVTSLAAEACRLDRKGWIRPGYDADLLIVRGDPLTELAALHRVSAVYRAGALVR